MFPSTTSFLRTWTVVAALILVGVLDSNGFFISPMVRHGRVSSFPIHSSKRPPSVASSIRALQMTSLQPNNGETTVKTPSESEIDKVLTTPEATATATTTAESSLTSPSSSFFDPELRRVMTSVATLGVLETAFLTYSKLSGPSLDICGTAGDCASVLNGPYATIPFTDIPLASLGLVAYLLTTYLAIEPVILQQDDTNSNRIALLALTTAMGTFSVFLMSLVYLVLQTSCLYCLASAGLSITLAAIAWFGGCLPNEPQEDSKFGVQVAVSSILATTVAAIVLFVSVPDDQTGTSMSSVPPQSASPNEQVQQQQQRQVVSPPPITTSSSQRALLLSRDLQSLHAKMYGAYWCSHCFDQKQTLGKQAFGNIEYMECAAEGTDSKREICQRRDVPGYPTWEIDGKLYPGERELDELEDIVKEVRSTSTSTTTTNAAAIPTTSN